MRERIDTHECESKEGERNRRGRDFEVRAKVARALGNFFFSFFSSGSEHLSINKYCNKEKTSSL